MNSLDWQRVCFTGFIACNKIPSVYTVEEQHRFRLFCQQPFSLYRYNAAKFNHTVFILIRLSIRVLMQRVTMNCMKWSTSQIMPGGINGGVEYLVTAQVPLQKNTLWLHKS